MNVVKCTNGHFYDGDSYTVCPHCGAGQGLAGAAPEAPHEKKGRAPLFGRKNKNEAPVYPGQPVPPYPMTGTTMEDYGRTPTEVLPENNEPVPPRPVMSTGPTLDFWQTAPVTPQPESEPAARQEPARQPVPQPAPQPAPEPKPEPAVQPAPQVQPQSEPEEDSSLKAAIKKASANPEGKTIGVFSMGSRASATAEAADTPAADPVVGWLVCIQGRHFGESFPIAAGRNSIGRSEGNHIVLRRENSVSREKHAWIVYEPKKRNFFLQPGESSGLTYLNDENIMESKRLQSKDIIEMGNSRFLFVPLCGEDFTWEDYMTKE